MKRITFVFISVFCAMNVFSDTYKILFLNTKTITIGGKALKTGDIFDDKQSIAWSSDKQAMKIQNIQSKKVKLLTAKQIENKSSLYDYYAKTNQLSTRGVEIYDHFDSLLEHDLFIADSIMAKSWIDMDTNNYFFLKYNTEDEEKCVKPHHDNKVVLFCRNDFELEDAEEKDIPVSVWFHFPDGTDEVIQESWMIRFIPLKTK